MSKVTESCGRMESFVFCNLCPCSLSGKNQQTYVLALLNGTGPSKDCLEFYFLALEREVILSVAQRRDGKT